jgi:hypothetical protein
MNWFKYLLQRPIFLSVLIYHYLLELKILGRDDKIFLSQIITLYFQLIFI